MTEAFLVGSWTALALIVRPSGTLLSKLGPRSQAVIGLAASCSFVVIPMAVAAVVLSRGLWTTGGLSLRGCGRLVWAILTQPASRPVMSVALLVLVALPLLLARGVVSAWRSQSASRALSRRARGPLVVVPARESFAFTTGLLRPRVVVSRGLLASTDPRLSDVVLAHEDAHRAGLHPMLLFVAESMARALPLAPLRWASHTLRFALESLADDRAAQRTGDRELVAEAVAGLALATVEAATAFEGDEVRRVRRLLAPRRSSGLRGAAAVAAVFGVLLFAGGHGTHCAADALDLLATAQCRLH